MIHPEYINPKKLISNSDVLHLFKLVENHGGVLRFVGGAVRDAIAGFKRADIDFVTDLSPTEFAEMCDEEGVKCVPIGIQFFTTGVVINNSFFKVTSLCAEDDTGIDEWQKDASLRDLTINAVYADEKGNVFDYYNGIDDLEKGIIKFIGNPQKAIEYDYIRIMRFFRFCAMFGRQIDNASLKACVINKKLLKQVSIEKIKEELFKIILAPNAVFALRLIFEYDILDFLIARPESIDNLEKLIHLVSNLGLEKSIIRRLFVLFQPNKQRAGRLADIFRLTHTQKEHLMALSISNISIEDFKDTVSINKSLYLYGKDVCRDMWISLNLDTDTIEKVKDILHKIENMSVPIFPITGKDLMAFGIDKKEIGILIEKLKKIWIEEGCSLSKQELIKKNTDLFKNMIKK